jgi:hypothetical protein
MTFFQGRIRDRTLGRRLKCPFCRIQCKDRQERREHMRVCSDNPKFNKEGVPV